MMAKNELPYMTSLVDEELVIAEDLSNEQLGAYYRLRLKLWRAGGFLPEEKLISASRAGKRWGAIAGAVLEQLTVVGGKVSMGSVLIALEVARKRRADRVEHATKAADVRWAFQRDNGRRHANPVAHGKPVSDVLVGQISDALLNASKSLKNKDPTMLGASIEQCPKMPNYNSKNLDNKILSGENSAADAAPPVDNPALAASGDAAGLSDGQGGGASDLPQDEPALPDNIDPETRAHLWLLSEGKRLTVELLHVLPARADLLRERWLAQVDGSQVALAEIMQGIADRGITGGYFSILIGDGCQRYMRRINQGDPLPMPPARPSKQAAPVVHSAVENTRAQSGKQTNDAARAALGPEGDTAGADGVDLKRGGTYG